MSNQQSARPESPAPATAQEPRDSVLRWMGDRLRAWARTEETDAYQALRRLPRPVARRWLKVAQQQADAQMPAIRYVRAVMVGLSVTIGGFMPLVIKAVLKAPAALRPWLVVGYCGVMGVWFVVACRWQRRVQRQLRARVEAELNRGRLPECPRCEYDLRGTPGGTCPECGASVWARDWEELPAEACT